MDRLKRIAPFLKPLLILALFAIALRVLHDTLAQYHYHDVIAYVSALPGDQLLLAVVLTLLGYLVMTGYDTLAFRYIRHPLPYFKIALASFIGYAFNNNVGFSGLVGGSLRYRLYSAWRLTAVEIAKVIVFCTISSGSALYCWAGSSFSPRRLMCRRPSICHSRRSGSSASCCCFRPSPTCSGLAFAANRSASSSGNSSYPHPVSSSPR